MPKRSDQAEAAATSDKKTDGDLSADHAGAPAGNNAPAAGSDGPPRCKSWKTEGPSLAAILLRFCNEHPRHNDYVRLFAQMLQSYGWEGCSCKYQEEVPYADMHGASIMPTMRAGVFPQLVHGQEGYVVCSGEEECGHCHECFAAALHGQQVLDQARGAAICQDGEGNQEL